MAVVGKLPAKKSCGENCFHPGASPHAATGSKSHDPNCVTIRIVVHQPASTGTGVFFHFIFLFFWFFHEGWVGKPWHPERRPLVTSARGAMPSVRPFGPPSPDS
jgi:hypothetical protein